MRLSTLEGFVNCHWQTGGIQFGSFNQKNQVHQIFNASVFPAHSWQRVGMEFFSELLLWRDSRHTGTGQTGKTEPITTFQNFVGFSENIAGANIQMELREDASCHLCFYRKTRAAVRCGIKIKCWVANCELETICEVDFGSVTEHRSHGFDIPPL